MSDCKGAAPMLDALPRAKALLGGRGYDADWFRATLTERKIIACIPSKKNSKVQIPHDTAFHRQRYNIENMFGNSRTDVPSTPATIVVPTHSCSLPASPQPSSSGSINES